MHYYCVALSKSCLICCPQKTELFIYYQCVEQLKMFLSKPLLRYVIPSFEQNKRNKQSIHLTGICGIHTSISLITAHVCSVLSN